MKRVGKAPTQPGIALWISGAPPPPLPPYTCDQCCGFGSRIRESALYSDLKQSVLYLLIGAGIFGTSKTAAVSQHWLH